MLAVNDIDTTGAAGATPESASVDLAAPGAETFSVGPHGPGHYTVTGSGVAAAYVAGAAALVRSYHPDLKQADVKARLEQTARPAPGGKRTASQGAGTLDVYAAVTAVLPPQHVGPVPGELATVVMPTRPGVHRSTRLALLIVAATALIFIVGLARRSARRPADTPPPRTEQERW